MGNKQVKAPVTKTIWCYIVLMIIAGIIIGISLSGCGARKSAVEVINSKTVDDTEQSENTNASESSTTSDTQAKTNQTDKVDEEVNTTTITKYDTSGRKSAEIYKTQNKKSTDNSVKTKTRTFNEMNIKTIERHVIITTHVTETTHIKEKTTDANNNAMYWMGFGLGVVLMVVYFAYRYFKK